jgi:uncharacterized membrane protein
MNKSEYITKLKGYLADLPESSQIEILADYEEHFTLGVESGKSEEEIATKLGDPANIAREVRTYTLIKKAETNKTTSNVTRAVLATLGLSLFNLIFIVGPYLGILGTLIGFVFAALAMVFGGIIGAIFALFAPLMDNVVLGVHPAAAVLLSLAITSFGVFFAIIDYYLIKVFYKITIWYLKLNVSIVKKEV